MSGVINDNHVNSSQNDFEEQLLADDEGGDMTNLDMNEEDSEEVEMFKARAREIEEEAERIRQMQDDGSTQNSNTTETAALSQEDKIEIDSRSIFVGNVDYSATASDLEKHFHGCGSIKRVTIPCHQPNGHPKGFAYIEFADTDSVETASALDESLFKGRQIKVHPKRTNRPGMSRTRGRFRGRGGMGGPTYPFRGSPAGYMGGGGFRPRGRGGFGGFGGPGFGRGRGYRSFYPY